MCRVGLGSIREPLENFKVRYDLEFFRGSLVLMSMW